MYPPWTPQNHAVRYGAIKAARLHCITVRGKSAHGAHPEKGIDAIRHQCPVINALQTITGRMNTANDSAY